MDKNKISEGINYLKQNDHILSAVIERAGPCTLVPHYDYFGELVSSIAGQQLSVKAADSILKKMKMLCGEKFLPEVITGLSHDELRGCGLSNPKVRYIKDLAEKVASGELDPEKTASLPDEEVIKELTKVKGIGIWTCHMFLIFTLGRPDVLPYGDLGIKRAIAKRYGFESYPDENQVKELSVRFKWSPYNTIASWYLWKSLEFND